MMLNSLHYLLPILLFSLCENFCFGLEAENRDLNDNSRNDFDVLIFTQQWPITYCMEWMDHSPSNACILPSQKGIWTIHGVWPTKFGTIGPSFCNDSSTFDVNALAPIKDQLEHYWMNIEKGMPTDNLWQHEWMKHGTCASAIEELNTENKYFGQGLAWLTQYTMTALLAKTDVVPDRQYTAVEIHDAVKNVLNTNPSIHCVRKKHTGELYLSEIRICFNKQLELVDCDGIKMNMLDAVPYENSDIITNCHQSEINYPSTVPKYLLDNTNGDSTKMTWRFPWVNLYKLIQIIKWFTL